MALPSSLPSPQPARRPRRGLGTVVATAVSAIACAALVAPGAPAVGADTPAATAAPASESNASTNPRLARGRSGYRALSGATALLRTPVRPHRGARYAASARVSRGEVSVALPEAAVVDAARARVAVDVRTARGALTRVVTAFRGADGSLLGTAEGRGHLTGPLGWRTVAAEVAVPEGTTRLHSGVVVRGAAPGTRVVVTNHVVRRTQVRPQPEPPTTPPTPDPTPDPTPPTTPDPTPEPPRVLDNSGSQPAIVAYGSAREVSPYAAEGALVIAGRENYDSAEMKRVSAAGGTVLVYLDAVIDNAHGRYHQLLNSSSGCGAATQRWPGGWKANEWGYLNDFRPGSVVLQKLECVLETIVDENPHIGGFFADDLGSRSWFGGFSWSAFGAENRQAYRDGAIEASRTFRRVSDRNGLVFMVNGTWGGGSLESSGGGFPNASQSGNALADGTFAENHGADGYWGKSYPCAEQWADRSEVTNGMHFNFAVTRDESVRRQLAATGCYAFTATQQAYDRAEVWGPFRRTGLPSKVTRRG